MKHFFKQLLQLFEPQKTIKHYTLEEMIQIVKNSATQNQLKDIHTIFIQYANEFSAKDFKIIIQEINYQDQLLEIVSKNFPEKFYPCKLIDHYIKQALTIRHLDAIELHLKQNETTYLQLGGKRLTIIYENLLRHRKKEILNNYKVNNPIFV